MAINEKPSNRAGVKDSLSTAIVAENLSTGMLKKDLSTRTIREQLQSQANTTSASAGQSNPIPQQVTTTQKK